MYYQVADYLFEVIVPEGIDCRKFLPSFSDFESLGNEQSEPLFRFDTTEKPATSSQGQLLEESVNDMGNVCIWQLDNGFRIDTGIIGATHRHTMVTDHEFRHIAVAMQWDDPYIAQMLSAMLRIAFSQALLREDGMGIHASAISYKGEAYLFLGKSGTGKSTHAALWQEQIPGCELINDDNPAIRIIPGQGAWVYGTPWSGKTPCYRNVGYPLAAITRLQQAPTNCYRQLSDIAAFTAIAPSCAVITQNIALYNNLCDRLVWVSENIVVSLLQCLPNKEAASTALEGITTCRKHK